MENQGTLKTCALGVGQLLNLLQDKVSDLLVNGVVPVRRIIGNIFLAYVEPLRVEDLVVGASANFISTMGFRSTTLPLAHTCQCLSH